MVLNPGPQCRSALLRRGLRTIQSAGLGPSTARVLSVESQSKGIVLRHSVSPANLSEEVEAQSVSKGPLNPLTEGLSIPGSTNLRGSNNRLVDCDGDPLPSHTNMMTVRGEVGDAKTGVPSVAPRYVGHPQSRSPGARRR